MPDGDLPDDVDRGDFRELFDGRAVVLTRMVPGADRDLAAAVNQAEGPGDAALGSKAELGALFEALLSRQTGGAPPPPDSKPRLVLRTGAGAATAEGSAVRAYLDSSVAATGFFAEPMWLVDISGWPAEHLLPADPVTAPPGALLRVWAADPDDDRHLPPAGPGGVLFRSDRFSLMNSGNRTKFVPKRSWKINFKVDGGDDRVAGMSRLNLKAMWNDPSQQREGLAWWLLGGIGVPAPRHTYARLGLNGAYRGLFSLIEEVDKTFLGEHFGASDRGNLYKAYCGDLGCASLMPRTDAATGGGGSYRSPTDEDATYRLKTNEDDASAHTYDDLAELVRRIDGSGLPGGGGRFGTDAYRAQLETVLDVAAMLRWAGADLLMGSWDNYFATPANYYLYNSGFAGDERGFGTSPYFTFIPWDYDNSFGLDYFGTAWQYTDIVDWPAGTRQYWAAQGRPNATSNIPMVTNALANTDLLRYYLDHLEFLLDTVFTPAGLTAQLGTPTPPGTAGSGAGLWSRANRSAYLESDTPFGSPFTGRQFGNDEVYRSGFLQNELRHGSERAEGIYHYVLMRYDSARAQLERIRGQHPAGSGGASFPVAFGPLPARP